MRFKIGNLYFKEPKTFSDVLKPLGYCNWVVGIGVSRQPNQSNIVYFFMQLYTIIINLIYWIMTYVGLAMVVQAINFIGSSEMDRKMYTVLFCTNACIVVTSPFLVWFQRRRLKDCFQEMLILDDAFQTTLGVPNEYRRQYICLAFQVTIIGVVMLLVSICDIVWSLGIELQMNIQSVLNFFSITVILHHPILVMLLLDVNFCTLVGYLEKKFRDLNNGVLGMVEKPSTSAYGDRLFMISRNVVKTPGNGINNIKAESLINDKYYSLQEIRKAHLSICKLSRKINVAFGIQNLRCMGISFGMITGFLYSIHSALARDNYGSIQFQELLPVIIWTSIYMFKIWMVNHYCWSVSNEAERTGEVIYEILKPRVDKEFQKEIQEFAVQMLHNPVRFNACGFFTLDYTFVQSVIGSITTYLVILIQMSNVSETPAAFETCNCTKISANE